MLGKFRKEIHSPTKLNADNVFSYKIEAPKPDMIGGSYSVSAYINMGWIPKPKSNEWIRRGDLLTDTMHLIDFDENVDKYTMDIEVILYNN